MRLSLKLFESKLAKTFLFLCVPCYNKTIKKVVSFLSSELFPKEEILETRTKPDFLTLVFGRGFIFVQYSQVYLPKMMQVRKKPRNSGVFSRSECQKSPVTA